MNISKKEISGFDFITSIFKFSISSWVNFVISIVSVIITTRVFPPDMYGNISMFNTAVSLLVGFACLGLDSAFMRFYNEPPKGIDVKQLLAKCLVIPIFLLVAISVIIAPIFYGDISLILFNRISWLVIVLLLISALSLLVLNYFSMCYRISNNAKQYTIQSILVQFSTKCLVIVAAVFEPKFDTVIIFNTVGILILTVIYFFLQRNNILPKKIDWSMNGFGEIFKYALYSWPIVIIIHFNIFFPQIIIKQELGSHELGIYASASFFVAVLAVIQNGFKTYWAAFMYANYETEQTKIKKVHDYVVLFVIFMLGMFILFQHMFYYVLGEQYQESRSFFTLILIYPLFSLITETTAYGITIAKKTQYSLIIHVFSILVNLICCYIFVRHFGIEGAAVASMLYATVYLILSTIVSQKYYKSIRNPQKTAVSLILIIFLASSNYFLVDKYTVELCIILCVFVITIIIYNNEIKEVYRLGRQLITRKS